MNIRKANLSDARFIAGCLLLAMEDIIYAFIGERDAQKAFDFLLYFAEKENNQYAYQNCWVAEDKRGLVGVVNIYDGARLAELRRPVLAYIQTTFGRDLQPEDETGPGEIYIDCLGVAKERQGSGAGTAMLLFLIEEYVTKRGETLGLLVDEGNPNAKRLYLRLGFEIVGRKVLLGKRMEHLQMHRMR